MSLYVSDLFRIMILFLPMYCVGRGIWLWRQGRGYKCARELVLAMFALFMLGLLTLTFRNGLEQLSAKSIPLAWRRLKQGLGVNLVPFRTIRSYLKYASDVDILRVNLAGNIVMFVPWGLGLPLLWKRYQPFWRVACMSVLLPLLIEFVQLFIGRSVDIDDIILNFAGGLLGGLLYRLLRRVVPRWISRLSDGT